MRDKHVNSDTKSVWEKLKAPFKKSTTPQTHRPEPPVFTIDPNLHTRATRTIRTSTGEAVNIKTLSSLNPDTFEYPIQRNKFLYPIECTSELKPIVIQPIDVTRCVNTLDRAHNQNARRNSNTSFHRLSVQKLSSITEMFRKRTPSGSVGDVRHSDYSVGKERKGSRRDSQATAYSGNVNGSAGNTYTYNEGVLNGRKGSGDYGYPSASLPTSLNGMTLAEESKHLSVKFMKQKHNENAQPQIRTRRKSVDVHSTTPIHRIDRPKNTPQVIETSTIFVQEESTTMASPTGFIEDSLKKVNQYHMLQEIGSGAYGRVVLCRHEDTGRYFACKIISKSRLKKKFRWTNGDHLNLIKTEIAILKKLSKHRNINALIEVLEDAKEDNLYMSIDFF